MILPLNTLTRGTDSFMVPMHPLLSEYSSVSYSVLRAGSGDMAIRPGHRRIYDCGSCQLRALELHFVEDQLLNMNRTMYETVAEAFEHFQRDRRVVSLERYRAIGARLMAIQEAWDRCTT
jgi:hypothetical protein